MNFLESKPDWLNTVLYNEYIRYFLLLIAVFILGYIMYPVKPWLYNSTSSVGVKFILIFFGIIIWVYDIDRELTYKNLIILFITCIIFTVLCELFLLNNINTHEKEEMEKLKKQLQKPEMIEFMKSLQNQ